MWRLTVLQQSQTPLTYPEIRPSIFLGRVVASLPLPTHLCPVRLCVPSLAALTFALVVGRWWCWPEHQPSNSVGFRRVGYLHGIPVTNPSLPPVTTPPLPHRAPTVTHESVLIVFEETGETCPHLSRIKSCNSSVPPEPKQLATPSPLCPRQMLALGTDKRQPSPTSASHRNSYSLP